MHTQDIPNTHTIHVYQDGNPVDVDEMKEDWIDDNQSSRGIRALNFLHRQDSALSYSFSLR